MPPTGDFNWPLDRPLIAIDNGPLLLRQTDLSEALRDGSIHLIALDPGSSLGDLSHYPHLQHFPLAMLGNGEPVQLSVCLQPLWNASLPLDTQPPLNAECQPAGQIIARLPVQRIALDAIEGLPGLDWLLLAAGHDQLEILEHGRQILSNTLLLQLEVLFPPIYAGQASLDDLKGWASQHGFQFHGFSDVQRMSNPAADEPNDDPGTWLRACALFIPDETRLQQLDAGQLTRLAFLLDSIHGDFAASYHLLQQADAALAEHYATQRQPQACTAAADDARSDARDTLTRHAQESPAQEALRHLADNRLYPAIELARRWHAQEPGDHTALHCLAEALSRSGQHAEALQYLQRLHRRHPGEPGPAISLAWAQWRAGQLKPARKLLDTLIGQGLAGNDLLRFLDARLLAESGKPRERLQALTLCESALHDTEAAHWLALQARLLAAQGQAEAALASYRRAEAALGDSAGEDATELYLDATELFLALGDPQAARQAIVRAVEAHPVSLATYRALGHLPAILEASAVPEDRYLARWYRQALPLCRQAGQSRPFGLPSQSLPALLLAGGRDTAQRLVIYDLHPLLSPTARVLDIRCRNGALLLALSPYIGSAIGLDRNTAELALAKACSEHLEAGNLSFMNSDIAHYRNAAPFDLIVASEALHNSGLQWEEFGEALRRLCTPDGLVLLESHGSFDPSNPEPDFADMLASILSAGFAVEREYRHCDDGMSLRSAYLLRAQPLTGFPDQNGQISQ